MDNIGGGAGMVEEIGDSMTGIMLGTGGDIGTSELEDEDIGNEVLKGRGPRMEGNE